MAQALVGLGSNLGEARDQVRAALAALTATWGVHEVRGARLHTFPAVGGPAGQADFVNTAARIETSLAADELLAALLSIEARLGRTRQVRWGPRTIDLDLLLYDDLVRDTPHLTLPRDLCNRPSSGRTKQPRRAPAPR